MTDGILLVLASSHFHCSDPSIPPGGPYVLYSSLKECRDGAWRHASALSNVTPNVAKTQTLSLSEMREKKRDQSRYST